MFKLYRCIGIEHTVCGVQKLHQFATVWEDDHATADLYFMGYSAKLELVLPLASLEAAAGDMCLWPQQLQIHHDCPATAAGDTTGEMGSAHTEVLYRPADGPSPCNVQRNQGFTLTSGARATVKSLCPAQ